MNAKVIGLVLFGAILGAVMLVFGYADASRPGGEPIMESFYFGASILAAVFILLLMGVPIAILHELQMLREDLRGHKSEDAKEDQAVTEAKHKVYEIEPPQKAGERVIG